MTQGKDEHDKQHYLLAIPKKDNVEQVMKVVLNEAEFLSDYGIRSLSKYHKESPFTIMGSTVAYMPGESDSALFGGNSNWRGPIWFPMNFLLIESMGRFHNFYGKALTVDYPYGSGNKVTLKEAANGLKERLVGLFLKDKKTNKRPCFANVKPYHNDPHFDNLIQFHEYFHGDSGEGLGASHQTGWTGLVVNLIYEIGITRGQKSEKN